MSSHPLLSTLSRSLLTVILFAVLFLSVLSFLLWTVVPRPLFVLAVVLLCALSILTMTAFFYWKEWRALPMAILFFLLASLQVVFTMVNAGLVNKTPSIILLLELQVVGIIVIALLAIIYLWKFFAYRARIKETGIKLIQSEEELRIMVDYSYDWEVWYDEDNRCKYMSPACERITGYTRDELMENSDLFLSIIHPDDREKMSAHYQEHSGRNCKKGEIVFRLLTRTGETRWIWHQCQAAVDHQGNWLGRRVSNRDITARHEIETLLRQERAMFMNGPVVVFIWQNRANWPVEYVSENVLEILGYSAQDFLSGSVLYASLIHPDDLKRVTAEVHANSLADSTHFIHEPYRLITGDGKIVWVQATTTLARDSSGRISHYQGYLVDITRTVQMEAEALATKDRLEFTIDAARLGTWDWNIQTGAIVFNERWAEMLGYSLDELEPKVSTWEKLLHPDEAAEVMKRLNEHLERRAPVYMVEHRLRHKSGKWVWILDVGKVFQWDQMGKPLRALGIHLDISKQKEQEQLTLETSQRQEQIKRMESLRTMAGAVAHQFNNSMTVVLGNLEMLRRILPTESKEFEMASMAAQAARESTKVGSSMLTYLGQGGPHVQSENLADIVRDVFFSIKDKSPSFVAFQFLPPSSPIVCRLDKVQIKSVIEAVLTNAIESVMQSTGKVEITFGKEEYLSSALPLHFREDLPEACTYAFCQISDNGCGIAPDHVERIFEPFFTTKFVGRGLGLAMAAGIMCSHHGAILAQSKLSEGTTIRVLLPAEE